jgi:hypothetical protein
MALYDVNGINITPEENALFQGKKMVCFGDSLTEVNFQYTNPYWSFSLYLVGMT